MNKQNKKQTYRHGKQTDADRGEGVGGLGGKGEGIEECRLAVTG